ncbi:hypothetical protein HN51_034387 [Arachis hypogaea]|uniref:CRM domain-containing protein n=1 Tax=Arachis hypogaea TaxID=3818 RepID=A0A445A8U2_ARAHY|nr:stress response protein NST1 [Arachis ipaensis]XP_025642396.1 stress response protein NST1 [Arachis hypogaea]QHN99232.1 putative RNA-binding protein YqeI [Arachis hypogaea]RYR22742.1 hypothetical protein Ahy_B03g068047 [Arachis hypogaea]
MASSATHFLHFLRSQPLSSSSSFVSLLKPLLLSSPNVLSMHTSPLLPQNLFPSLTRHHFSSPSLSLPHAPPPFVALTSSSQNSEEEDDYYNDEDDETELYDEESDDDDDLESERSSFEENTQIGSESNSTSSPLERKREERLKVEVPSLSVKERKELASYAHSLGKKLKTQLVGKSGVTPNVATSFIETLEANELLKIKIHRSCPGELEDVVKQLEEATGSVAVGKIGRTLIIYRPSLTKLKAEEKKKQVRQLFLKRQLKYRQLNKSREQVPKLSRRGSSSSWKVRSSRS